MPKKFTAVITKENLNAGTAVPFLTDTEMLTLSVREINLTEKEKLGMIFSPKAIPFEGCPQSSGGSDTSEKVAACKNFGDLS